MFWLRNKKIIFSYTLLSGGGGGGGGGGLCDPVTFTNIYHSSDLFKFAIIFLSISLNMCFGCSKEPSH